MDFDVGASKNLGQLNSVYSKFVVSNGTIFPCRQYDTDAAKLTYMAQRKLLQLLPHYYSYGLVICNPELWCQLMPSDNDRQISISAYKQLKDYFKSQLSLKSAQSTMVLNKTSKMFEVEKGDLEMFDDQISFLVIPRFFALEVFGVVALFDHYPTSIVPASILSNALPGCLTLHDYFNRLCVNTKIPRFVDFVKSCTDISNGRYPLTRELTLNIKLRAKGIDQLAIVAASIFQLRQSIKDHSVSKDVLLSYAFDRCGALYMPGGVYIGPCGTGKTKTGMSIWHGLCDPFFDGLEDNAFGFIPHNNDDATTVTSSSSEVHVEKKPSIASLLLNSISVPLVREPTSKYHSWLKMKQEKHGANFDLRDRSVRPLRTLKLLWVVYQSQLVFQTARAIKASVGNVRVKILKESRRPNPKKVDVVVASMLTIISQNNYPAGYFENFGLVIYDEAHQDLSDSFKQIFNKLACIPLSLHLTATPRNHSLRWLGGPVIVAAERPFVKQRHVVLLLSNIPKERRQERIMMLKGGDQAKMMTDLSKKGNNGRLPPPNTLLMAQDMVRNIFRTRDILNFVSTTFLMEHLKSKNWTTPSTQLSSIREIFKVSPIKSRTLKHWSSFLAMVHAGNRMIGNVGRNDDNIGWSKVPSIINHHDNRKSKRVPIFFSKSIHQLVICQHFFAQVWLDIVRGFPHLEGHDLKIVRLGLRKIAIVDFTLLSDDIKSMFRSFYKNGVSLSSETSMTTSENTMSMDSNTSKNDPFDFGIDFWQSWFKKYPLSERLALEEKIIYPFKIKSNINKNKRQKKNDSAGISNSAPSAQSSSQKKRKTAPGKKSSKKSSKSSEDFPELDNGDDDEVEEIDADDDDSVDVPIISEFSSSDWIHYSQFGWTPFYHPIPGLLKKKRKSRKTQSPKNKEKATSSKKRKRNSDDDDDCDDIGVQASCEDHTIHIEKSDSNIYGGIADDGDDDGDEGIENDDLLQTLEDTRPTIPPQAIIASFGLIIGAAGQKTPYRRLNTERIISCKEVHNEDALSCDYIFSNISVAATGVDREDADTTIHLDPDGDSEQTFGRAMRECETKQEILHVQVCEPMSVYRSQMLTHMSAFDKQNIQSEIYVLQ